MGNQKLDNQWTTLMADVPWNWQSAGADDQALWVAPQGDGRVLTVGVGKDYATLGAAVAASQDGDIIAVDAGTYDDDTATVNTKITIVGVGGIVNLVATHALDNQKGLLVVNNDLTVANVSFSGASIPNAQGANGAGIRYQGGRLTLINDVFTGNQDGLLATPVDGLAVNTITIDHSTFVANGDDNPADTLGYGYTHNAYIGAVDTLTVTNSVFADVNGVGHELKSRAYANDIENNVIMDGSASASYSIDLPNGGQDTIAGNYIEKGADAQNGAIIHYGGEGFPYASSSLTIQNNDIVNKDIAAGSVAVLNQTFLPVSFTSNTITGLSAQQLAAGSISATNNVDAAGNALADSVAEPAPPSDFQVFTDAIAHTVTLANSNAGVRGGAGLLTVIDPAGHVSIMGGSGGLDFIENAGAGGSTITTTAGAVDTIVLSGQDSVDAEGTDTITVGTGNAAILVNGTATITSGPGTGSYTVNGSASITGAGGSDFISMGSGGYVSVGGTEAYLEIDSIGGNFNVSARIAGALAGATVLGGSVGMRSYDNALNFVTSGGLGQGATIILGAGAANIRSAAADTIYAGTGPAMLQLSGGGQTVYAGLGTLSIYGRSIDPTHAATVYGNGGDVRIDGDTGNIVYRGGGAANTVEAVLSNITLVGGAGHLTINGGARDTITGGTGGITLNGGAADTITTSAGSTNTLTLAGMCSVSSWGTDLIDAASFNQSITLNGNGTIVDASGSNRIAVLGTGQLTALAGNDQIDVGAGASMTVTTAAWTNLTETNGTVTYTATGNGAPSSAHVSGGTATVFSAAGQPMSVQLSQGAEADLLAGSVSVVMGNAATLYAGDATSVAVATQDDGDVIYGGSGALALTNQDWTAGHNTTVHGGTGSFTYATGSPSQLTFLGGSGSAVIDGGWGVLDITAGSGATTVRNGSGGALRFTAGSGSADVTVSALGGTITGGSGSLTVTEAGWGGADIYDFVAGSGGGQDVINGFRAGIDQLRFSGVAIVSSTVVNGSTSLVLSDQTRIQLTGVIQSALAPLGGLLSGLLPG